MFTNKLRLLGVSEVSGRRRESEGSQPVTDAMADAGLRVVIGAPEPRGRVPGTLIGPTVSVLFATARL